MDLVGLIAKSPELFGQLKQLGLDGEKVVEIGGELNRQLRVANGPDLADLLIGLDVQGFIASVDLSELINRTGINTAQAVSVIELLAPAVMLFEGEVRSKTADEPKESDGPDRDVFDEDVLDQ